MAKGDNTGGTMNDRQTFAPVPERRGMKDARGDGGVPGRVGTDSVMPGNWSLQSDPTPGYKPPGRRQP